MSPEPVEPLGEEDDDIEAIDELGSALERADPAPELLDALGKAAFDHRGPPTPRASLVADEVVAESEREVLRRLTLSAGSGRVVLVEIRKLRGSATITVQGSLDDAVPAVVTPDGGATELMGTEQGWEAEIGPTAAIRLVAESWHSEWVRL